MNKSLTEHVQGIGKDTDVIIESIRGGANNDGFHAKSLLAYPNQSDRYTKPAKKDILLSQLKTIELVKEELEGMKKELHSKGCVVHKLGHGHCTCQMPIVNSGYNSALSQAITLLDTIIKEVRSQIK
jgi:hypothetical protein